MASWGRGHDVRSLFLAEAAIIVMAGAVNPILPHFFDD